MKQIRLILASFVIIAAILTLMGYHNGEPIMLFLLAVLNAVIGWENYHKNKRESAMLFLTASFVGLVSVFIMFF